ncbi:hypothetical protein DFH07DRAFT_950465 [Mycena maculata]|uniref:Uncharacterized protein n=1 Tax=Mycena maculata TaxID=230809 RepID=A0AAD7K6L2_9AGAR|nr:hypothetical protein DFH07DRAFT_950465 [Mycena maculata]
MSPTLTRPTHKQHCAKIVDTGITGIFSVVEAALNLVNPIFTNVLKPLGDEEIMGMVQVSVWNPQTLPEAAQTKTSKYKLWSIARELERNAGLSVGVLDVTNGENRKTISSPIVIDAATLDKGTFRLLSTTLEYVPVSLHIPDSGPCTYLLCTMYLNTLIRADTKNALGLRITMRPIDFKAIRDAGLGVDSLPALTIRDKMEREALYGPPVNWAKRNWVMSYQGCLGP